LVQDEATRAIHGRLEACRLAVEYVALVTPALEVLSRESPAQGKELKRASLAIHFNVAAAAGKSGAVDQSRCYAVAWGSAMDCGAILDSCRDLGALDEPSTTQGKALLARIVATLAELCR